MDSAQYEDLNRQMGLLADGDRSAFEPIFQLVWPVVKNFAERALNDPLDAEDAAQSALIKIFSQASDYRKDHNALPWVLTITAYECKTLRQKRNRRRENLVLNPVTLEESADETMNAEERLSEINLYEALNKTIENLPPLDRETIMIYFEKKACPNVPSATFRKRLERTIKKIRVLWSENYAG